MHTSLASLGRCCFGLDPNVDRIVGGITQVLHLVLEWRKPSGLAGVGVHLLHLSMLIGELEPARRWRVRREGTSGRRGDLA